VAVLADLWPANIMVSTISFLLIGQNYLGGSGTQSTLKTKSLNISKSLYHHLVIHLNLSKIQGTSFQIKSFKKNIIQLQSCKVAQYHHGLFIYALSRNAWMTTTKIQCTNTNWKKLNKYKFDQRSRDYE